MLVKNLSVKCKQPKKDSFHRYYVKNIDSIEIVKKKDTIIKKTNEKEALKQDNEANESYSFLVQELGREAKVQNSRI